MPASPSLRIRTPPPLLFAASLFRRRRTTLKTAGEPLSLVVGGPFRRTRNPLFLPHPLVVLGARFGDQYRAYC